MLYTRYVDYVHDRFHELRGLLESRGWTMIERGDLSEYDEGRRIDPVMGVVRIRGTRENWPMGGPLSFTVKEWWGWPPLQGAQARQGCVLAGYHYTAVSPIQAVRHCYDSIRHPGLPFHVHLGEARPESHPPIDAEEALDLFEQRLAEELVAKVGGAEKVVVDPYDDDFDAVFGEPDS